jgi:phosphoribosyl-ATP pyrophosphohydrolase
MQILRCTAKLQKEMGLKKSDLSDQKFASKILGQWHSNLIYINRKKCVLFVNDDTLFNFIVADLRRNQIKNLADVFRLNLSCVLHSEGIKTKIVDKILDEYSEIAFAKSDSRKVLGNLNDLAFHYEYFIKEAGGVHSYEVPSIIKNLNRMPMKREKRFFHPADEIKSRLRALDTKVN